MKLTENAVNNIKRNRLFYFKFIPTAALFMLTAALLLVHPEAAADGVKRGMSLCLSTVIPSLFPFLLVTTAAYDIGMFDALSEKAEKLTRFLFALPGASFPVIAMSLIGGFPVGAHLIEKALDKGELTYAEAQRMLLFCVNPGPAFTVSAIGAGVLGSKQAGIIIYVCVSAVSLLTGVLSRFFTDDEVKAHREKTAINGFFNSSAVTAAVNSSISAITNICVWVVVFSCADSLLQSLVSNGQLLMFFRLIFEVTNGAVTASEHFNLPIIAAVISFAGICVHFQIMPCIIRARMKYKYFLAVRALSAALTSALAFLVTRLFPESCEVISLGVKPQQTALDVSFPVCVWLMLMCGLFIIGDNYIIAKKAKKTEGECGSLY